MLSILCFFWACSSEVEKEDNPEDSDTNETETETEEQLPVTVSVQLLDITGGDLPAGITLTSDLEEITLDASSAGEIQVPGNSQFEIMVEAEEYVPHRFTAMAGEEDLSLVSFFAAENLSLAMYGMLDLEANPEKGILVVAVDNPDLSPAVGAAVSIDTEHDGAFVMAGMGVDFSNIVSAFGGFVAFPNVAPGETSIEITPPEGKTCWFHAAGDEGATVEIATGQATVAFFICD